MERKIFLFYLKIALFIIFFIISGFYIFMIIEDISHLWNPYYGISESVVYLLLFYLIPGVIFLSLSLYLGKKVIKDINDNVNFRNKKFKLILPIMALIISVLGILAFYLYGIILSLLDPSNNEIMIGVAMMSIIIAGIGFASIIIFWIIGFFIDRSISKNNFSLVLNFLKILRLLLIIMIIISIIVIAFNIFQSGCLPTDNKCLLEKAIAEQNPEICKNNHWCYKKYYETQNSTVCSSLPNNRDKHARNIPPYNIREDCYAYFAYKEKNIALCDFIREEDRDNCRRDNKE